MAIIGLNEVSKRTGLKPDLILENEMCGWFPRRVDDRGWHEEDVEMWCLTLSPPLEYAFSDDFDEIFPVRKKIYHTSPRFIFITLLATFAVGFLIGRYFN